MIHVHSHEFLGQTGFQIARELQGVIQRFFVVIEGVLDALTHQPATFALYVFGKRSQQYVASQGQRKIVGVLPPAAQIENVLKAAAAVGQLALMDDEASVDGVLAYGIQNLVERYWNLFEVGLE